MCQQSRCPHSSPPELHLHHPRRLPVLPERGHRQLGCGWSLGLPVTLRSICALHDVPASLCSPQGPAYGALYAPLRCPLAYPDADSSSAASPPDLRGDRSLPALAYRHDYPYYPLQIITIDVLLIIYCIIDNAQNHFKFLTCSIMLAFVILYSDFYYFIINQQISLISIFSYYSLFFFNYCLSIH